MDQEKIGKFIAEKRKEKNMTQEQLAEKLGISTNAVSKWERGLCLMDISLLKPLSEILDVSIQDILTGEKTTKEIPIEKTLNYGIKFSKEKIKATLDTVANIFTALCLAAIVIVIICDYCITGSLSWSKLASSSIIYAWIIIFTFIKCPDKCIRNTLIVISLTSVPFFYFLSIYFQEPLAFKVGSLMTLYALIYLWSIYFIIKKFKNRYTAIALAIALTIPLTLGINMSLSLIFKEENFFDIWDIISTIIESLTAMILFTYNKIKRKGD